MDTELGGSTWGEIAALSSEFSVDWQEEGLFVRDYEGRLLRLDPVTAADLGRWVTITIDGYKMQVRKAVPATDELGIPRKNEDGEDIVRATTIHDAASLLARAIKKLKIGKDIDDDEIRIRRRAVAAAGAQDGAGAGWDWASLGNPIPVLCHQEYMEPVAVCRVCVVQVSKLVKDGGMKTERKLLPACQHRVEDGMVVETAESLGKARERIRGSVGTLVELMMSDHPSPCAKERQRPGECELEALSRRFAPAAGAAPMPAGLAERPRDHSSLVIAFDPNACILCDRCVRGCDTIKENHVIGRMGKGYATQIAFDLGAPMGGSSCVACGECVDSCPTGALTTLQVQLPQPGEDDGGLAPAASVLGRILDRIRPAGRSRGRRRALAGEPVTVEELIGHAEPKIRQAFLGTSRAFLRKNIQAVVRRRLRKGEPICKQGEYGKTAFMIEQGRVDVTLETEMGHVKNRTREGMSGPNGRFDSAIVSRDQDRRSRDGRAAEDMRESIPIDAPASLAYGGKLLATLQPGDLFGEMTCMNHYPRSATAVAAEDGVVVLEMLRNVLYIMQRSPGFRRDLENDYRKRAVENLIRTNPYFAPLRDRPGFEAFVSRLTGRSELRQCEPGELIIRQGTPPQDGFYIVRTGFVKVTKAQLGGEIVLAYRGPNQCIGEMALLAEMSDLPEVRALKLEPVRSATCTALDHVELVWIRPDVFREDVIVHPEILGRLVAEARQHIDDTRRRIQSLELSPLEEFLERGLMNANHLLVLDLEKCTRCDECTKACSDTHGGVTRLIREGLRFDKFLVASSCRSCLDPYCLVGCPVGSITRNPTGEILIADWCIGCGLCAENCPYGNINMVGEELWVDDNRLVTIGGPAQPAAPPRKVKAKVYKATTCDLCTSLGPNHEPSCVYACPHDAAHRYSGDELLEIVRRGPA